MTKRPSVWVRAVGLVVIIAVLVAAIPCGLGWTSWLYRGAFMPGFIVGLVIDAVFAVLLIGGRRG